MEEIDSAGDHPSLGFPPLACVPMRLLFQHDRRAPAQHKRPAPAIGKLIADSSGVEFSLPCSAFLSTGKCQQSLMGVGLIAVPTQQLGSSTPLDGSSSI